MKTTAKAQPLSESAQCCFQRFGKAGLPFFYLYKVLLHLYATLAPSSGEGQLSKLENIPLISSLLSMFSPSVFHVVRAALLSPATA